MSWQTYKTVFGSFFEDRGASVYAVIRHPLDILSSWWRYRQRPEILSESHHGFNRRTSDIAFSDWAELWSSKSNAPSTRFSTQKETLQAENGKPAPIQFFHLSSLRSLQAEMSDLIGQTISFGTLNVSPKIDVEADENMLLRSARYCEELEFFEALSERAV